MKTIYYVIYDERTQEYNATLGDYETLHRDTFNPYTNATCIIDFTLHGRTYQEKKAALEEMAKEWQANQAGGLYMNQYAAITDYFEENAKKYGLVKEFKENAII